MAPRQPTVPETGEHREPPFPRGGRMRGQACQARRLPGQHSRESGFEFVHGALDDRLPLSDAGLIEREPFLEQRRTVDNEVRLLDKLGGVLGRRVLADRDDLHSRVEFEQPPPRGLDTRLADTVVCHQQLPIQVTGLDVAGVRQHESADAGGGEFVSDDASKAADTSHQHGTSRQTRLPRLPEVGDRQLPVVDRKFFGGEWTWIHRGSAPHNTSGSTPVPSDLTSGQPASHNAVRTPAASLNCQRQ
ncbi:MAG: hypothetical protein R3B90_08565 [Planctomycetaceae bacterium]